MKLEIVRHVTALNPVPFLRFPFHLRFVFYFYDCFPLVSTLIAHWTYEWNLDEKNTRGRVNTWEEETEHLSLSLSLSLLEENWQRGKKHQSIHHAVARLSVGTSLTKIRSEISQSAVSSRVRVRASLHRCLDIISLCLNNCRTRRQRCMA